MTLGTALFGRFTYLQPSCTCVSWQLEKYPKHITSNIESTVNVTVVDVVPQHWLFGGISCCKKTTSLKWNTHVFVCACMLVCWCIPACMYVCMYICMQSCMHA